MIEAEDLCRDFGALRVVDGISFRVEKGEAVGFLGPNGAGKTTTFRMLTGSLGPTAGAVRICGLSMQKEPRRAKACLGYMPENAPLYPEMKVDEYLRFRAELKGVFRSERARSVQRVAEETRVTDVLYTLIGHLSKGYRQRVALAETLLAEPQCLLLDEPTAGLDPNQVAEVRKLIRELARERAVLVSTHILSEVEATCTRAIVVNGGRVVAAGPLEGLTGNSRLEVFARSLASSKQVQRVLDQSALSPAERAGLRFEQEGQDRVKVVGAIDLSTLVDVLRAGGLPLLEAGTHRPPLEAVFAQLTGKENP